METDPNARALGNTSQVQTDNFLKLEFAKK